MKNLTPTWKRILGVPHATDLIGDYKNEATFAYKFKILWAKTFLAWDDYSPPTSENPAGKLYGEKIPVNSLDRPSDWWAEKENLGDKSPYTFKNGVKAFFGFPYKEQNGLSGVRLAGFVIKLIPKIMLNTLKLFSEILTGSMVAASETLIAKATYNYNFSVHKHHQLGWYFALTLGRIFLPISSLLHFTGKAITSPLDNMIDTWKYFADMRAKKEWYWKALGYGLGFLGGLFSVAVTATMYFLLAPVMAAIGTFIAGSIGLSSAVTAVTASLSSLFNLIGPVTGALTTFFSSFLPAVLSPTLTALSGFVVGVLLPTVVAPILTGVDKAVSWLANKVVSGAKFLINKISASISSKKNQLIIEDFENIPQEEQARKPVIPPNTTKPVISPNTTANLTQKMTEHKPNPPTKSTKEEVAPKETERDPMKIFNVIVTTEEEISKYMAFKKCYDDNEAAEFKSEDFYRLHDAFLRDWKSVFKEVLNVQFGNITDVAELEAIRKTITINYITNENDKSDLPVSPRFVTTMEYLDDRIKELKNIEFENNTVKVQANNNQRMEM